MSLTRTTPSLLSHTSRAGAALRLRLNKFPSSSHRSVSTLSGNSHIYIHPTPSDPSTHTLSLLSTSPPNPSLSLGTTTALPPTPSSTTENPHFFQILHAVLRDHATSDPAVQAQAQVYASQAGANLGGGGLFLHPQQHRTRQKSSSKQAQSGAGGASAQGGMGGGNRGGWVHVSDTRNPPDFGRTAWPEDIFGSVEIDAHGAFVEGHGRYQAAGTYRLVTNEGVLGLSGFLREKVVQRLKELDGQNKR